MTEINLPLRIVYTNIKFIYSLNKYSLDNYCVISTLWGLGYMGLNK